MLILIWHRFWRKMGSWSLCRRRSWWGEIRGKFRKCKVRGRDRDRDRGKEGVMFDMFYILDLGMYISILIFQMKIKMKWRNKISKIYNISTYNLFQFMPMQRSFNNPLNNQTPKIDRLLFRPSNLKRLIISPGNKHPINIIHKIFILTFIRINQVHFWTFNMPNHPLSWHIMFLNNKT